MTDLKGKVVVVTGAGSGIGRALAEQFAAKGARLALSDVNAAGLEATLALLPAGTEARGYALDVSNRDAVFAHADAVHHDFGTAHVVVNNAGTSIVGTFEHLTVEEIEWQLGINLWGVIYGCKAFLPTMLAQRDGVLVNISSVFGLLGFPLQSAYNVSKFGVRGLTECLWSELDGTGVRAVATLQKAVAQFEEERRTVATMPSWGAPEAYLQLARRQLDQGDGAAARSALERRGVQLRTLACEWHEPQAAAEEFGRAAFVPHDMRQLMREDRTVRWRERRQRERVGRRAGRDREDRDARAEEAPEGLIERQGPAIVAVGTGRARVGCLDGGEEFRADAGVVVTVETHAGQSLRHLKDHAPNARKASVVTARYRPRIGFCEKV